MAMLAGLRLLFERLLQSVVIVLMVGLTGVVVTAVVYRKLGVSLSWYDEVASIMLAWLTYYGAGLAALKRAHIGFEGLVLAMPLPARMACVVLAELVVLAFFVILTWTGLIVLDVLEGDTLVSLTFVPVQFTQSVIPIGGAIFLLAQLVSLPEHWGKMQRGESEEHPPIIEEQPR